LLSEEKDISDKLKAIKDEAAKFENELNQLRNDRQVVSDKVYSFEIKETRLNSERKI